MKHRVTGFDVARAFAIFGMVIVNFKIAMNAEIGSSLLITFAGLFEGRASALFVILAGIGVTFLSNRARKSADQSVVFKSRLSLIKRGLLLVYIFRRNFPKSMLNKWFYQTGQLALTLYVAHVIVGMGFLEAIGRLENQTINFSLFSALVFCVCGIGFSAFWLKYFEIGPLEWVFRKVSR